MRASALWDFQAVLSRRLLLWSAISVLIGGVLLLVSTPFWRGFGVQAVLWGAIDATIAAFGLRNTTRQKVAAHDAGSIEREARKLRRLLWINTGLDVLYIGGGILLALTAGREDLFLRGAGWGIVVQGVFLFLFDLIHARSVPLKEFRVADLNVFQGPEHRAFQLEGEQPAAVLVHGFPGTPAEMRPLAEMLHQDGWTVHGLLLPGFGPEIATLSQRHRGEWIAAVNDALSALRQAGHRPLLLIGYSMGAAVSLSASAGDARPDGLVLLAPFWWQARAWLRVAGSALRPFLPGSFRPFRRANFANPQFRHAIAGFMPGLDLEDPQVQQAVREIPIPLSLIEQVLEIGQDAYRAAPQITAPTLVVQGARDEVVRASQTRKLLAHFAARPQYREVPAAHDLLAPPNAAWPEVSHAVTAFAAELVRDVV
jgi:carboxylesterase